MQRIMTVQSVGVFLHKGVRCKLQESQAKLMNISDAAISLKVVSALYYLDVEDFDYETNLQNVFDVAFPHETQHLRRVFINQLLPPFDDTIAWDDVWSGFVKRRLSFMDVSVICELNAPVPTFAALNDSDNTSFLFSFHDLST